MTSGRFISKSVSTDEALNRLSWQAQACFLMAIPHLDRDGLITGNPLLLLAQIAPLRAPELVGGMVGIIEEWLAADLVVRYDSAGQPVLFFPGFLKHQKLAGIYNRERASMFEPPPGYTRTAAGLVPAADETDIAPNHDQLATNSRSSHPIKQQDNKRKDSKTENTDSSSSNKKARASGAAAAAQPHHEQVDSELYNVLSDFGVAEPTLTALAAAGKTVEDVCAWIAYINKQNLTNPVGYLVKRLRAGDKPPGARERDDYEELRRRYVPDGFDDIIEY